MIKRSRSVIKQVLAVNMVITLILLGIMLGNSLFLLGTVRRNSDDDTEQTLEILANTFEKEYLRLNRLMTLCNDDSDFILALASFSEKTGLPTHLKNTQTKMSLIKASVPYADNVYAYKAGDDTIITTDKGVVKASLFLGQHAREGIEETLAGKSNVLIAIGEGLYFICPIQNYGSIVIDINCQDFYDMLVASPLSSRMEWVVYDRAGDILLKEAHFLSVTDKEYRQQHKEKILMGDTAYYVSFRDIPSIGYSCEIFTPVSLVESNLQAINAGCILALAVAALLSLLLVLYNHITYRPVQKLFSDFGPKDGTENEVAYITRRLEELKKAEWGQLQLGGGNNDLNIALFYLFYNEIDGIGLNSGINRLYDGSSLSLLAFQDITGQPDRQLGIALAGEWDDVIAVNCDAYVTAFIIPKGMEKERFLCRLKTLLEARPEGKAFVSFSRPFTKGYSIREAFTDSLAQLETTEIESAEVLTVSGAENRRDAVRYIKLDIQQQIVNCVIKSNIDVIEEILGLILQGGSSLGEYRYVYKTIASLLDYMVNTWGLELRPERVVPVDYDKMYHPEYMRNSLLNYFHEVGQAYQKKTNVGLREQILEYLERNYMETMSLDSISERFHITPAYLSSFFKKEVGENISVYLANLRIAEAKRLLEETNLKVSEVSEQVGIYSQTTFIRLFKKNCGMTPNEYRKMYDESRSNGAKG